MFYDVDQRQTIEYVKEVKEGRGSFKPSHIATSEKEIERFIKGGRLPNELAGIMSEVSWKRELDDEQESSSGGFLPILLSVGSVLYLFKKFSLPFYAKISLTTFSFANGLGVFFLLAGALGTILFILSSILK